VCRRGQRRAVKCADDDVDTSQVSADPYAELGVPREATDAEIKAAYEKAVTKAARDGLLENAKRIDAAYEVLRDPVRRATFDRTGHVHEVRRPDPTQGFYAATAVPWRAWSPDDQPAVARRRDRRGLVAIVVAAALVALALVARLQTHHVGPAAFVTGDLAGISSNATGGPPVTTVAQPRRVVPAVTPPAGDGGYLFEASARFDPCRPIRYVISGNEPFAGADTMLTQALAEAGRASGLSFVYAGRSSEPAGTNRPAYHPGRYGRSWAPVLVAWTDATTVPALAGNVNGLGGAIAASVHGQRRLVSGLLYFDAPELFLVSQRGTGYAAMRTVMLHEIGHLLGLGHVQDPQQVMYPTDDAQGGYAAGDLRGLAYAGAGPCSHYQ
jgi:hypothetical protein